MAVKVQVVRDILQANDQLAGELRGILEEKGVLTLNLMGSPGSGKTTVLEKTIKALGPEWPAGVVEGDIESTADADRIAAVGAPVVQINTGGACHLDANMVRSALGDFGLDDLKLLFIENVGNLVCPSSFDLGENIKVVVLSVAEGDDKPMKYPGMCRVADVVLINKMDLLPYCDCDVEKIEKTLRDVNGDAVVFRVSAREGTGIDEWCAWLRERLAQ